MPFIALGDVVYSRYYSGPLKVRMPTKYLKGSNPLNTGFMESREAIEK